MLTKLSMNDLIANMEACAKKVTGRSVTVRFIVHPHALGLVQKNLDGGAVLDLDPSLLRDVAVFVDTFTHELAHVVKHFDGLPRRDISKSAALEIALESYHLQKAQTNPVKQHEDEAESLARAWRATVKRHYESYYLAVQDPALSVLKILYHRTGA